VPKLSSLLQNTTPLAYWTKSKKGYSAFSWVLSKLLPLTPWCAVEPLQQRREQNAIFLHEIRAQQNPTYWENFPRAKKKAETQTFPRK